ncbi:MAG: DUF2283 domain-containing protein [Actinomycetota bacterium]
MAVYTYDEEVDALYILLVADEEASIAKTEEIDDRIHVDLNEDGVMVGIEILYPGRGVDLEGVRSRYGLQVRVPFKFAA